MILLDAPYVSEFLKKTVETLEQPVLDTSIARSLAAGTNISFIDEPDYVSRLQSGKRVYTNSENSLDLVIRGAGESHLARQIEICKDKVLFRETTSALYPDYRFMGVDFATLDKLTVSDMAFPVVVKPARGFFSLGVHMVRKAEEWPGVVKAIEQEREALNAEDRKRRRVGKECRL